MPTITISQPAAGIRIDPTATNIVFDIVDPLSDPGRTLVVDVNAISVLTQTGGLTTFLDADYVLAVTTPALNTTRFTLTKLTPWINPLTISVDIAYSPDGILPPTTESANVVCATYTITIADPAPDQIDCPRSSPIRFSFDSTALFGRAEIDINTERAVTLPDPSTIQWNYPNFHGNVQVLNSRMVAQIQPRRVFNPETYQYVTLRIWVTLDQSTFGLQTIDYRFFTRQLAPTRFSIGLYHHRISTTFGHLFASERLRAGLLDALRITDVPFVVLVYYRMRQSSLRPTLAQFNQPQLAIEAERLTARDLAALETVYAQLQALAIYWEPALQEANGLGLSSTFLDMLRRDFQSQYPQDCIGAVCALVFAQALRL